MRLRNKALFVYSLISAFLFLSTHFCSAEDCSAKFDQIDSDVLNYANLLKAGQNDQAEETYQQIQKLIFTDAGESGACLNPLIERYVLDSFNLYIPNMTADNLSYFTDKIVASHPYRLR